MRREIKFFLPMIPPTATGQMKKVSTKGAKPVFYDPPTVADARAKLSAYLSRSVPESKLTGPVMLMVMWLFPPVKGHRSGDFKTTRPDTDNLQKILKDEMQRLGYFANDAQVCVEHIEKRYDDTPGICIQVSELEG